MKNVRYYWFLQAEGNNEVETHHRMILVHGENCANDGCFVLGNFKLIIKGTDRKFSWLCLLTQGCILS